MTLKKMRDVTIVAMLGAGLTSAALAGQLTVYTAIEAEDLARYEAQFETAHPDIDIDFVRDSTGIITAKILAERNNPQADVVWGLAGTSLLLFKTEGMLETYAVPGADKLDPKFADQSDNPQWVGMDAWVGSVCVNTVEAEKNNLPIPGSWKDLLDPVYEGHVVMPNPNSSGTGFLDVNTWLQMYGEEAGWEYMDGLHKNIARYTHSGSKPCKLAGAGEIAIGISFANKGAGLISKGAPLKVVVPSEGVGWEMEAAAIMAGTDNLEDAKVLMEWSISKEANEMYNVAYAVVGMPGVAKPVENFPPELIERMFDSDFEWSANNRSRILEEWQSRYDGKSDPKG